MKSSITALIGLGAIATAAPTTASTDLTSFFLVTTSSPTQLANSSQLPDVSATSLFDPNHQTDYLLRLIAPGYNSLPQFNLTSSTLQTDAYSYATLLEYDSTNIQSGAELIFRTPAESKSTTKSNIGLKDGYLLNVDGDCDGWSVCDGEEGENVIYWKGTDPSCVSRYIQAVKQAPY